jgi:hypothetical protein
MSATGVQRTGGQQQKFPVFVIGAPRSGTTLLYSLITSSREFSRYKAESRILECSTRYGDISRRRNALRFLDDFFESRQWYRSGLNNSSFRDWVLNSCRSWEELLEHFMVSIATRQGRDRWVEKTPNHVFYMRRLATSFPTARFIHIVRDGRDVALSHRKLDWLTDYTSDPVRQLLWGARIWEQMVREGRRLGRELGDRYHEVQYRDLVSAPDREVAELESFIGASIDLEKLAAEGWNLLGRGNSAFESELEGLSRGPIERWRQRLSDEELALFEWAVGDLLEELSFPLGA